VRQRRKRLVVIASVSVAAAVAICCLTGRGWRIVDTCTWRAMITFKVSIAPADDGYCIVVDKSDHRLSLYKNDELLRAYPIAISHRGLDARHRYDDLLTPEGEFLIASMQYTSVFGPRQMLLETTTQALVDYQLQYGDEGEELIGKWEAQRGPLDTIWEVYDYNEAHPGQEIWHDILIHGGGSSPDWTWGCIALDDDDVIELFELLQHSRYRGLGVPVIIER
jgi:hypothetical protein